MQNSDAGRHAAALEPLHSMIYFVPESAAHLTAAGVRPGRMVYFAGRSAAMGAVGPGVVAATFNNFNPASVREHLADAWMLVAPPVVVAARLAAADEALRRLLGTDAATSPEVAEAAALTRRAAEAMTPAGRPLYAAYAELDWPEDPLLGLFHGITLLREHRGDGHIAALTAAGLSGIESIVTHSATGRGFTVAAAQATRGWSPEQWAAAQDGLRERGLLDGDGALTDAGTALRRDVEDATNRMAVDPWRHLGDAGSARLVEIAAPLAATVVQAGTFGRGVFEPGSGRLATS